VPVTADVGFLPPERLDDGEPTSAGDVYGVGATAFFLLTGRPPVRADDPPRLLEKLRAAAPPPLEAFRPDAPKELVKLVKTMLASDPRDRPTAAQVVARLTPGEAEVPLTAAPPDELAPLEPAPPEEPAQGFVVNAEGWAAVPLGEGADPAAPEFTPPSYHPGFEEHATAGTAKPAEPKPAASPRDRKKLYMWVGIGLGLQLLAVAGWILFATQPSWLTGGTPQPKIPKSNPTKKAGGKTG